MFAPPRRLSRGTRLAALLFAAGLATILAIYVGGFFYLRDHRAFSERLVTFEWRNIELSDALKELLPGQEIRFLDTTGGYLKIKILHFDAMEEREVVRWLCGYCRLRIRQHDGIIEVSKHPWFSQGYLDLHWWLRHHLGFSPWGQGPANQSSPP